MNYRAYDPDQQYMLPADLSEVIPKNDLVYVVDQVVRELNLKAFYARNSEEGNPAYHPAMMLKVLFYGYSIGLRSSRKIARAVQTDVRFMYLAARQQPDFHTIARFRQENIEEIKELFSQIVAICARLGMVSFAGLAVDGTKIRANASRRGFQDKDKLRRYLKAVRKRISEVVEEASDVDTEEDHRFRRGDMVDRLPKGMRGLKDLQRRIKESLDVIEKECHRQSSPTDPDAVFIKGDGGRIDANYNCQAGVDMESRVILSADVCRDASDNHQLEGMVEGAERNVGREVEKVVADAGYYSIETDEYIAGKGTDAYLPDSGHRGKNMINPGLYSRESFVMDRDRGSPRCPSGRLMRVYRRRGRKTIYRGVGCAGCDLKARCTTSKFRTVEIPSNDEYRRQMREKLRTPEGEEMMGGRASSVELVFAWMKHHYGGRNFLLRGLEKVKCEWNLMAIGHNLRRIGTVMV